MERFLTISDTSAGPEKTLGDSLPMIASSIVISSNSHILLVHLTCVFCIIQVDTWKVKRVFALEETKPTCTQYRSVVPEDEVDILKREHRWTEFFARLC